MGGRAAERVALMAIHERYAEAIMDGTKLVEFRKRRLADDIETVWVYATAPVSKVIGSFSVHEIVEGTPEYIWQLYGHVGVIERAAFFDYYRGSGTAIAIVVGSSDRLTTPLPLQEISPQPAVPQSFAYLPVASAPALTSA